MVAKCAPLLLLLSLGTFACKSPADTGDEGKAQRVRDEVERADSGAIELPEPARRSCNPALASLARLEALAEHEKFNAKTLDQQLRGRSKSATLTWIAEADEALGRMDEGSPRDVALIESFIREVENDPSMMRVKLVAITTQIRAVVLLEMRRLLDEVASGRAKELEAEAAWAKAGCLFLESLVPLSNRADQLGGDEWTQTIRDSFAKGRLGIAGELVASKVAKQQIEKSMYAVIYRLIIADAEARTPVAANEALGLLDAIEDRLADRNSPGLARMRRQFNGPPADIDPALVERELAVAFTKRARKYCDKAVVKAELGQPDAIAETWEGIVYSKVILPSMREALAAEGFDADAYTADWQRYLAAVESSDSASASEISARLVEWNCAYQDHLGIAEGASATDETQ